VECSPDISNCGVAATQTEEGAEDDEDEDVLLHIPRWSRFEDYGSGAARGPGVGTVEPFDAAGMFGNLWWQMQLRWYCGQKQSKLYISPM